MKISLSWLSDYVDLEGIDPESAGLAITMHTAEVEGIERKGEQIKGVVLARVTSVKQHPQADRLTLCSVDDGQGEELQVVCGAPNVKVGGIYPFARTGARLPGGLKIGKSRIRGIESHGMLLSRKELGVGDEHEGLWELNDLCNIPDMKRQFKPGQCAIQALNLCDIVYEVDNKSLTHRPDLWGHFGFARELSAIYNRPLSSPKYDLADTGIQINSGEQSCVNADNRVAVHIDDVEACYRYSAALIDGIRIMPSPRWLQARLEAVGQRPINNVVDATNYVMLELGQPMHAFDAQKLVAKADNDADARRDGDSNRIIRVRRAADGEILYALDGTKRNLNSSMLVIADHEKPVALAGIIGGADTEVGDDTGQILLESACFEPGIVRRAVTALGLRTEAANRFEKAQDPENTIKAIVRFMEIIRHTCSEAIINGPLSDAYPVRMNGADIDINGDFIRKKLGVDVEDARFREIFSALGFEIKDRDSQSWSVGVPSWRATKDVGIPEDLVEEAGRIIGYDNIPVVPPPVYAEPVRPEPEQELGEKLRDLAVALGLTEIYCYSLTSENVLEKAGLNPELAPKLSNPLSRDADRLRISLVPEILSAIALNLRHSDNVRIFEFGRVYYPREHSCMCGMIAGKSPDNNDSALLFQCREMLRTILSEHGTADFHIKRYTENLPFAHHGRSGAFYCDSGILGVFAEIHPRILKAFNVKVPVSFFQIMPEELLKAPVKPDSFEGISRFPTVPFDVAAIVPEQVMVQEVEDVIREAGGKLLKELKAFDVYRGPVLPAGSKSVAFSMVFGSSSCTLQRDEIERLQDGIVKALEKNGYQVRKFDASGR